MNKLAIELRLATVDDIPTLKQLIPLSVRELSQGYYTPSQVESALVYVFGVDSQLIADGTYYTAVAGDEIVGCGGWSKRSTLYGGDQMKSREDNLLDPSRDAARIRAFFVHPQWARRGIGKQLILKCEEATLADGFRSMELGLPYLENPFMQRWDIR